MASGGLAKSWLGSAVTVMVAGISPDGGVTESQLLGAPGVMVNGRPATAELRVRVCEIAKARRWEPKKSPDSE